MQTQTTEALLQHNEKRTKCLVYTRTSNGLSQTRRKF